MVPTGLEKVRRNLWQTHGHSALFLGCVFSLLVPCPAGLWKFPGGILSKSVSTARLNWMPKTRAWFPCGEWEGLAGPSKYLVCVSLRCKGDFPFLHIHVISSRVAPQPPEVPPYVPGCSLTAKGQVSRSTGNTSQGRCRCCNRIRCTYWKIPFPAASRWCSSSRLQSWQRSQHSGRFTSAVRTRNSFVALSKPRWHSLQLWTNVLWLQAGASKRREVQYW